MLFIKSRGGRRPIRLALETLESRRLLSGSLLDTIVATPSLVASPDATSSTVAGLSPSQVKKAYGLDQLTLANSVKGDGAGQTIAIVGAYNAPTISNDLKTFDAQFSLSDPSFKKVSQTGSATSLPASDAGWALELSLDVEWAHAVAPKANILLVEAMSASLGDLLSAVDYARHASGVSVVSMSWGADEFRGETSYDSYFTTPAGHQGVTFVAASGDSGSWYGAEWPAVSPGVLSVGGTKLNLSSSGVYSSETGWSGSGGGISSYEREPSYQSSVQSTGRRTTPDVAYNADPNSGFAVYDSTAYEGYSGWEVVGGTSAGTPQWAGLIAIANQARAQAGKTSLNGLTQTLPAIYSMSASNFHDVTLGQTSFWVSAFGGYDLVSGRGTPKATGVVSALKDVSSVATSAAKTATATTASQLARAAVSRNTQAFQVLPIQAEVHVLSLDRAGIEGVIDLGGSGPGIALGGDGSGAGAEARAQATMLDRSFGVGVHYGRVQSNSGSQAVLPFATHGTIAEQPLTDQMLHAGQLNADELDGSNFGATSEGQSHSLSAGLNLASDEAGREGRTILAALAAAVAMLAGQRYRSRGRRVMAAGPSGQACTPWCDDDACDRFGDDVDQV